MLSETLDLQPNDVEAWIQLASAQELRGQFGSAQSALERARQVMPHKGPYVTLLEARVKAVANHGEVDSATMAQVQPLVKTNRVAGAELAYFFAALGQRDTAIALLSRDVSNHDSRIDRTMQKYDPRFDSLRSDPRFKKIFG